MESSFLQTVFTDKIDKTIIKTIVECGSRDCLDAIELRNYYIPDIIYSFECNPESIIICEDNIKNIENIKLIPKAVYNENKEVEFYATDMDKSIDKNIGASSLLIHRDETGTFVQKQILVRGIRLDTFMENEGINKIDLLCMDIQGTECMALEGLGERIHDVHYLISEVLFQSYYHGDMLMPELIKLLSTKGFKLVICDGGTGGFGNVLFENMNFNIDFNNILFGEMLPYERYKLYNWIINIKPTNILEVGCGVGGSTYCMAEAIKKLDIQSNIYTCDPERHPDNDFFINYPFVKYHQITSDVLISEIIKENTIVDFIFFDGPEIPELALNNILVLEKYIKDGTYFSMHDWEYTPRGFDGAASAKAQLIRPYIENSNNWIKVEVLSGLQRNEESSPWFDSVGLCLYKFIGIH